MPPLHVSLRAVRVLSTLLAPLHLIQHPSRALVYGQKFRPVEGISDSPQNLKRTCSSPRKIGSATRILGVFVMVSSLAAGISSSANAAGIASERETATRLYAQIQATNSRVEFLGQQYDLAQIKVHAVRNKILSTRALIGRIERIVGVGKTQLRADAIFAYVTNGASSRSVDVFTTDPTKTQAAEIYNKILQGNIGTTLALLESNRIQLTSAQSMLVGEIQQAVDATRAAAKSFHEAMLLQASLHQTLSQVKGRIANLVHQQEVAAAAQSAVALRDAQPVVGFAAPPANSQANIAVRAALSFVGVPYVWGGASRQGVDCSGLTMLAYQAAGIYLPHYSGSQYAATVPVPLFDLRPGDLLFYGAGGGEHEAMYLGNGKMIEAEHTGTFVLVTDVRLGYGFVGAGRPRV